MIPIARETIIFELSLIESYLSKLPVVNLGIHTRINKSNRVIRYGKKEIYFDRAPEKLRLLALRRDALIQRRILLMRQWRIQYSGNVIKYLKSIEVDETESDFDSNFFYKAKSQALSKTDSHTYFHNGFWMRSRAETILAQRLDELGYQYKYEVQIPGTDKFADFVIFLPSLNSCFFLEYLGRVTDRNYFSTNMIKIGSLLTPAFQMNRDIALLYGTDKTIPDKNEVFSLINVVIYNQARSRFRNYVPWIEDEPKLFL